MNKKQTINLAVWVILAAISFGVLFVSLIDSAPYWVWERDTLFDIYATRGCLSFITTAMLFSPWSMLHEIFEED